MKIIPWVFGVCACLSSSVFAANQHTYPQAKHDTKLTWTDGCEIEIVNRSYADVSVFGIFDDGVRLDPFNIYSFELPHYISLYYNGYCHAGMELDIDTFGGEHIYSGYVRGGSTVRIVSYFMNQVKAHVQAK